MQETPKRTIPKIKLNFSFFFWFLWQREKKMFIHMKWILLEELQISLLCSARYETFSIIQYFTVVWMVLLLLLVSSFSFWLTKWNAEITILIMTQPHFSCCADFGLLFIWLLLFFWPPLKSNTVHICFLPKQILWIFFFVFVHVTDRITFFLASILVHHVYGMVPVKKYSVQMKTQ